MISSREIEALLRAAGFKKAHQTGSHMRFVHPDGRRTTLTAGAKDFKIKTLRSIEKQSGVKIIPKKGQ